MPDNLNSPELELALIGALYTNPEMLSDPKVQALEQGDLSVRAFEWLTALREMFAQAHDLDTILLKNLLGKRFDELGGYPYIASAQMACDNTLRAPIYAGTMLRARKERRKRALAGQIARGGDIREAVDELRSLSAPEDDTRSSDWRQLVKQNAMEQRAWQETPDWIRGYSTGISKLDRALGGINAGLISIYGATSMGKSTLARQFAVTLARQGAYVVIAPTEMSPSDVIHNLAGEIAGIPVKQVRSGYLNAGERDHLYTAMRELHDLPIVALDDPCPTPTKVYEFVRARVKERCCSVLIVDSGSNLKVPEGRGEIYDETRIAAGVLKDIAYEFDIPVIASWQTGRNDKNRSPVPRIGDAKGASDVEYNSHVVISIFRPYYYKARKLPYPEEYINCKPTDSFLSVLKDRSGGAGDETIPVMFVPGRGFVGVDEAAREASA